VLPPSYTLAAASSPVISSNIPPSYKAGGATNKEPVQPAGLPPPYTLAGAVHKEPVLTRDEIDAFDMSRSPFRMIRIQCIYNRLLLCHIQCLSGHLVLTMPSLKCLSQPFRLQAFQLVKIHFILDFGYYLLA